MGYGTSWKILVRQKKITCDSLVGSPCSTEAIIRNVPQNRVKYHQDKKHVWPPHKLTGCLFTHLISKFSKQNAKNQYLCVHWQKTSQQALSARFSNYAARPHWSWSTNFNRNKRMFSSIQKLFGQNSNRWALFKGGFPLVSSHFPGRWQGRKLNICICMTRANIDSNMRKYNVFFCARYFWSKSWSWLQGCETIQLSSW